MIVIDTETTGLEDDDELLEFGAVAVNIPVMDNLPEWGDIEVSENGEARLIKPTKKIPPESMAVHHITDEMAAEGMDPNHAVFDAISELVMNELEGSPAAYVAHNANFDRKFLNGLYSINDDIPWICTFKVACRLYHHAPSHKNSVLFYYLNLHKSPTFDWGLFFKQSQLHRALPDAFITAHLLRIFLTRLSIDEMIEISKHPALLPRVNFGKHKGEYWDNVDLGYINWVLDQDFDEDVVYTAMMQKSKRNRTR